MGTQNTDVDYDWIPKETLERDLSKYRNFVIPADLLRKGYCIANCLCIIVLNLVGKIEKKNLGFGIIQTCLLIKHCNKSYSFFMLELTKELKETHLKEIK